MISKPIVVTFGIFLLIYLIILYRNDDLSTVIPSFDEFNTFDSNFDSSYVQVDRNKTNKEIPISTSSQTMLNRPASRARIDCQDNIVHEKSDIQVDGQTVSYSTNLNTVNSEVEVLNVYLVFHSHIDPGWLLTFDEYYNQKVKYILENVINFLSLHPDARFIWSEMSYLEVFYKNATLETQMKIKSLIKNGQLELCGGAWVMTDEATVYFWASIDNIIEGQRFILDELNSTAKSSWSVDPFGHGAANPYLLSLTKIENLVVGRLDRHVKENLAKHSALLFRWAQPWNTGLEKNLPLISSLPRTYYTTVDACGPDSTVCCQFDFGNARSICPVRAHITNSSVAKYASMLADQYYRNQPYYGSKHLLIPIGDDFFFKEPQDFVDNYRNYRSLMDQINSNPQYKMNIKFSTVSDYFERLRKDNEAYPILRGDFFPYTEDQYSHYPFWTGFYVHRPKFKRLERIIQGKLRRLDILRTLLGKTNYFEVLQLHRRNLALVQHHDAITGTSKPHVMQDYLERLLKAEQAFKNLEADALGNSNATDLWDEFHLLKFDSRTKSHHLTVFNQQTSSDFQRVSILVDWPSIVVTTLNGLSIKAQIFPHINLSRWQPYENIYRLIFYIRVPALSAQQFILSAAKRKPETIQSVENKTPDVMLPANNNPVNSLNDAVHNNNVSIDCGSFSLQFDEDGLLTGLTRHDADDEKITLRMSYGMYDDNGGSYVFAPSNNQQSATLKDRKFAPITVIESETIRVYTKLQFSNPSNYDLFQLIEVPRKQSSKSIEIRIELISSSIHLESMSFVMNLETDIDNGGKLFTDVNGLYLTRRKMNVAVNHAGNFYPAPTAALIEDHSERLTVLFGQPTGVTTSNPGHLEFFVDRNMRNNDGKGLSFGDSYTNETGHLHYRILFEKRDITRPHKTIYLSQHAHNALEELLHPSLVYRTNSTVILPGVIWPCNIQLINIRHLFKPSIAILLILRRIEFDCTTSYGEVCASTGSKILLNILTQLYPGRQLRFTSLTGSHNGPLVDEVSLDENLKPFQIVTLKYE